MNRKQFAYSLDSLTHIITQIEQEIGEKNEQDGVADAQNAAEHDATLCRTGGREKTCKEHSDAIMNDGRSCY